MKHKSNASFRASVLTLITLVTLISVALLSTKDAQANRSRGSQQNSQVYEAELERLIKKNKAACQQNDECVALKIGHVPCGGPRKYLAIERATLARIEREVNDLTSAITELEKVANQNSGQMGICIAQEEPKLECFEQSCRGAQAQPDSSGPKK